MATIAKPRTRLELNKPEFEVRAQNFFNLMRLPEFQQAFLDNPGRTAARELGLQGVERGQLSTANRLIHKLLVDPKFNQWAEDFQQRIEREFPALQKLESIAEVARFVRARDNRSRLVTEFSRSAVEHLSPGSFEELFKNGVVNSGLIRAEPDIALVPLTFIAIIVVLVIAAGYGRPSEKLSRITLQLTINQLSAEQQRRLLRQGPTR
jgi:hypothetical protein